MKRKRSLQLIFLAAAVVFGLIVYLLTRSFGPGHSLEGQVSQVASEIKMISPAYNSQDNALYFFDFAELKVAKVDQSGQITYLSDYLSGVEEAVWSPDFSQVILRNLNDLDINPEVIKDTPLLRANEPNGVLLSWLFDLKSKQLTYLGSQYGRIIWVTPNQIVFHYLVDDAKEIRSANPKGQNSVQLASIGQVSISDVIAYIPNQGIVFTGGNDEESDDLYYYTFSDGKAKLIAQDTSAAVATDGTLVYRSAQTNALYAYKLSTQKSEMIAQRKDLLTTLTANRDGVLGLFEKGAVWYDARGKVSYNIKADLPFPNIDLTSAGKTNKSFYFTSDTTLYRLQLP